MDLFQLLHLYIGIDYILKNGTDLSLVNAAIDDLNDITGQIVKTSSEA